MINDISLEMYFRLLNFNSISRLYQPIFQPLSHSYFQHVRALTLQNTNKLDDIKRMLDTLNNKLTVILERVTLGFE